MATATTREPNFETVAGLPERLGGIPPERIRLVPTAAICRCARNTECAV